MKIKRLLIANRGEISVRIARTCRRLGIESVAVYSDADEGARHVAAADRVVRLGPGPATESYLSIDKVLAAVRASGADAVHPGYGFLSENAGFAEACRDAGVVFVGPTPAHIRGLGSKGSARRQASALGIPVLPGYDGDDQSDAALRDAATAIGFPVLVKASAGGGGRGMRLVREASALDEALAMSRREALAGFGNDQLVLESFVERARHLEVQIVGDRGGRCLHLGDRDCTVQRHHQKVVEEAPAPFLPPDVRASIRGHAVALGRSVGYESLGTVEFLFDPNTGLAYFLEMNTRIQVEHPITEQITGLDLVELQLRIASGEPLPLRQEDVAEQGAAIELRVVAERPERGFMPQTGVVTAYAEPTGEGIRVDSGIGAGSRITANYDGLLLKFIAHGPDRATAQTRAAAALAGLRLEGVETNRWLLARILGHEDFTAVTVTTRWLDGLVLEPLFDPVHRTKRLLEAAACALALHAERAFGTNSTPWHSLGAWRLTEKAGVPAVSTWHLADEDRRRARVRVHGRCGRYRISLDDREREVTAAITADSDLRVCEGAVGERFRATVAMGGVRIADRDGSMLFALVEPEVETTARQAGDAASHVSAPLPGAVTEVRVRAGDRVEAGDVVAVMEAMKMVHFLAAARGGVVEAVLRGAGDTVVAGERLVVLAAGD